MRPDGGGGLVKKREDYEVDSFQATTKWCLMAKERGFTLFEGT